VSAIVFFFDLKPERPAADTAYGSAANLYWLVNEQKIAPHIPVIDKSNRSDGTLSRDDFTFDKAAAAPAGASGKGRRYQHSPPSPHQSLARLLQRNRQKPALTLCPFVGISPETRRDRARQAA
jgi:hypothetical protein